VKYNVYRLELRDMLQAALQVEIGKISYIHFLGRGCYHVEFEMEESVVQLLLRRVEGYVTSSFAS
jgi:hypothetical protein